MSNIENSKFIKEQYKPMAKKLLQMSLKGVNEKVIDDILNDYISENLKTSRVEIFNDYKGFNVTTDTLELTESIYNNKPIITPSGMIFEKHGTTPNLISKMLEKFLDTRNKQKAERKKYPKGSYMFKKFDLAQLLSKIDANSMYGVQGMYTSLFYNIHVATSVTATGQSLISASGLFLEMFLNDNVKLSSLDEMVGFIYNIISEKDNRKFKDCDMLDCDVDVDSCFAKVIMMSGFNWIPTEKEMNIVYTIIHNLDQEDINRIYYKNNLYSFILYNEKIQRKLIDIMSKITVPMIFPTDVPKNVKEEWDEFTDYITEYVYYPHQIVDRLDKYSKKIRSVSIITDTDSVIASLAYWYYFVLELTKDIDLPLRYIETDALSVIDGNPITNIVPRETDDSQDRIKQRHVLKPGIIAPQEGLRYTILNLLSYMLDLFLNDYMVKYVNSYNAIHPTKHCLMILKNEFLFKRVLVKEMRKNYASIQELQEGTIIPKSKSLDIKGLTINKSTLKPETRKRLKHILKEYVLDIDKEDFSQVEVVKQLNKFEDEIYQSLISGSKDYYKPLKVKPIRTYDDPLGMQGIKASMVYNIIKNKYDEPINLDEQNALSILKIDINKRNIDKIKDIDINIYNELYKLINNYKQFKTGINTVAVPEDATLPEWILQFINFKEIISDNIKNFPIEDIGILRGRDTNPYTTILKF